MNRLLLGSLLGCVLFTGLTGCSDSNNTSANQEPVEPVQGRITLVDNGQPATVTGDRADTIEVEIFDAAGQLVYGPIQQPLAPEVHFDGVPDIQNGLIEIDYLRNGGFLLLRAEVPIVNGVGLVTPLDHDEQPVDPHATSWEVQNDGAGFNLTTTIDGEDVDVTRNRGVQGKEDIPVRLKGVCYSPAPIQYKNVDAPSIGDLFWDTTPDADNWFALWGKGSLPYNRSLQGRDDLSKIRALGCNSLRVYCMLSRQLFVYDENANPAFQPGKVPSPPDAFQHFTHKEFLDKCWNNGKDPLYVLVGIPMPPEVLYRYGGATPELKAYWEFVLKETATDVGNHPAVIGFTLFNEIDENRSAWPEVNQSQPPTGGVQNADSDFYYGRLKEYSATIKSVAPGKLVGWAAHDNQPFVYYGSAVPTGNPYFTQLTDIDFYGVNTYQSKTLEEPLLGNLPGRFGSLTGANKKPVIFTEFGWPGVGHRNENDLDSLYEDATTHDKAAKVITDMVTKAFANDLVLGVYYFEFSDEWWKQPPYALFPGDPSRAATWNGGPADPGMPNGYHDQEAFGLYSTALGSGRTSPQQSPVGPDNAPVTPVDPLIPRDALIKALSDVYATIK